MIYNIAIIVKLAIAAIAAVILGNGCVVMFNHLPVKWFEDWKYDDGDGRSGSDDNKERVLPDKLLLSIEQGHQRLPSTPWKLIFVTFFLLAGLYLAARGPAQYMVGTLIVLAIVLLMAISDALYQIVPDQLGIALALSAVGFIGLSDNWWEPIAGAGAGLLLVSITYGLGKLLTHKAALGGADIKFYIAMGLVVGRAGIIAIYIITSILIGIESIYLVITKPDIEGSKLPREAVPMLPAALVATAIYMLFLYGIADLLVM